MTTTNIFLKTIFALLVGTATTAFAQTSENRSVGTFPKPQPSVNHDERRPHIGALVGFTQSDGGRMAGAGDIGVEVGFQPYIPYGLGLELGASNNEVEQVRLMARGTYNFGGHLPLIRTGYIGAAVGPVWGSIGDRDKVLLGFAPLVGFDIPIYPDDMGRNHISMGLQAKYIIMEGSDPDNFNVNGVIRYWY